ncbi:hypothetical protein V6N13_080037 [Hibiscus sabdariffa]|uniref:Uncharacterized protein n=1 Tax=Hibiscus sabdariffa TaxID=183260 RepID=A0ABR2RTL4_9ROSI
MTPTRKSKASYASCGSFWYIYCGIDLHGARQRSSGFMKLIKVVDVVHNRSTEVEAFYSVNQKKLYLLECLKKLYSLFDEFQIMGEEVKERLSNLQEASNNIESYDPPKKELTSLRPMIMLLQACVHDLMRTC